MSTTLLTKPHLLGIIVFLSVIIKGFNGFCQETAIPVQPDSLKITNDTIPADSLNPRNQISPDALETKIDYKASDSIKLDIANRKAYLYRDVEIEYEDISLKAYFVIIDFAKNTLYAEGFTDSTGKISGKPEFSQGSNAFTARALTYNFDTKKGLVRDIFTKEGDSYLHGSLVKRFPDNTANIKKGFYTTCELEDPHFEIRFTKARVIPDDKIVSGPAYMVIEDVPTPLALPFGFFPNKKGQLSGILLPSWGESANRGFYFDKFGYYWGVNDYLDLTFQGDIYTRGSWAAYLTSNYKKRYRYSGKLYLSYANNIISQKELPDYQKYNDFAIEWSHQQDPKARPNSSFSAHVKAASNSYYKFNSYSTQDYLSNTFESSIAYQTSLFNNKANFAANLGSKQNVQTHEIELWLPQINFSVNTFYPFRKKKRAGALRWYENINASYVLNAQNYINTYDTILLTPRVFDLMQNGIQQSIPIKSSVKILKYVNWTNAINLTERWYLKSIYRQWYNDADRDSSYIRLDTANGFKAAHEFNVTSQITTKIYGIYQFKKGPVKAIRHVMTPTVGLSYHPDFGKPFWGYYYYTQTDSTGRTQHYSIFQNSIYGSPPDGLSGKVNFSLANNLEMKVKSKKDTITGTRKVVLIDYLSIASGYDFAKDSLNWDYLTITARTKLFKRLDITFNGAWDPYVIDQNGTRLNQFEWKVNHRLLRRQNTAWNLSLSFAISDDDFKKKDPEGKKQKVFLNDWNLNFNFIFSTSSRFDYRTTRYIPDTVLTGMVSGEFYITPKWKVGFTTGFDFVTRQFSYTSLNIYRDLHCWEMSMEWIPYGFRKSYNFTIRVKSSVLQDLKVSKKSDWKDNF